MLLNSPCCNGDGHGEVHVEVLDEVLSLPELSSAVQSWDGLDSTNSRIPLTTATTPFHHHSTI